MNKNNNISVFGLGKLGCTMLACFAHKGWNVIGVDLNEDFISKINNGESPIYEPRVDELIKNNKDRITATLDVEKAVMGSDISFVIVPTPSQEDGSFKISIVDSVVTNIAKVLASKNDYHVVVITSTVLPGDTKKLVEKMESVSGKKCNVDFGVCYNPDFIALGTVVRDFLNPDMILIGQSDEKAGSFLSSIHEGLVDSEPSIHHMSFENAELAKISLNAYCTLKITFANVLAEICDNMPDGNVDFVTNAIGSDTRVGRKYLKGGLSYGGPCFPRDNKAFAFSAKKYGVTNILADKTDQINNYQKENRIPEKLIEILKETKGQKISILGVTYKADTTLVEEAAPISIIRKLASENIHVQVYDPAGMDEAKEVLGELKGVNFTNDISTCLSKTDLCFIAAPWSEFKSLKATDFKSQMNQAVIYDAWNLFEFDSNEKIDYRRIGNPNPTV